MAPVFAGGHGTDKVVSVRFEREEPSWACGGKECVANACKPMQRVRFPLWDNALAPFELVTSFREATTSAEAVRGSPENR